jgi:hypothetical protein
MDEKKSFWTTLPGVLTAVTGLVTAIGGIITILYQVGIIETRQPQTDSKPPQVSGLEAPIPEQPACASVIKMPEDGSSLTLAWGRVNGASTYTVEADCFGCGQFPDNWYSLAGQPWHVRRGLGLRSPIYSSSGSSGLLEKLYGEGGRSLRWRVWAVDPQGGEGQKSNWCQISFAGDRPR